MRHGDVGAFLRREGLYTSHITEWRKQRDRALERWLEPQKPGPKPQPASELAKRVAQLEREKAKLEKKLKQAEAVIELQKNSPRSSRFPSIPSRATPSDRVQPRQAAGNPDRLHGPGCVAGHAVSSRRWTKDTARAAGLARSLAQCRRAGSRATDAS